KAHHEKHLAIRCFRADPELIEIEADCPSYESYIETTKWFGWLREEIKNQMGKWFDIVPSRDFGLLPSVGDLKAHLKDWQVFSEDKRPQFTLDRDRMFELLQGAGLYNGKEQAMRELLQNAVDATLIRIWREHGEDTNPKPTSFIKRDSAPRDETVREILKKYPLDVKIEKEKENEEDQFNYWRITITDQGTGISRHDLEFLMSMGSSKKNHKKRAIAEKMPIWMKPSGIFGIGFHSVFLLTDEVIIETRSIDTGETLVINLTNPTNNTEHGNIYFQIIGEQKTIELPPNSNRKEKSLTVSPWDFSRYGCQLSFVYKAHKESSPSYQETDGRITKAFQNHDGLTDHSTDFHIFKIADGISDFFDNSLMSGTFTFAEDEPQNLSATEKENNGFYYYSKEQELELTELSFESNTQYSYRWGKIIFNVTSTLNFFRASANFLDAEADKILNISRNKFKEDKLPELHERVYKAIREFFDEKNDEGKKYYEQLDEPEKIKIAIEYKYQKWQSPNYFLDWTLYKRNITINNNEELKPINELKNYDTIIVCNDDNLYNPTLSRKIPAEPSETKIKLDKILEEHPNSVLQLILKEWHGIDIVYPLVSAFLKLKEHGFKSAYLELIENEYKFAIVKLSKNINEEPIKEEMLRPYCLAKLITRNAHEPTTLLVRSTIPCLSKYKELELKDSEYLPPLIGDGSPHFMYSSFNLDLISPRMLFPLARIGNKITVGKLEILAERVYKNRADEKTTPEEIKMAYQKFIQMLDNLMADNAEWVEKRGNEFNPSSIVRGNE
ncbi:MAG: ATP-binding protein, partial [Methylococcales bacterium]|nr:ATP-binding protein [Methylococcales bacterium]